MIQILSPNRQPQGKPWPVVYVLPVEAGEGQRWGSPLDEVRRLKLDLQYDVIWAFPTFADLPWYADHPSDEKLQQESYLIKDVLPAVESHCSAVKARRGRFLVGFSKSGWGAWSLLLRHPDLFQRALAWDAPMMMSAPGKYGSGPIFATKENFLHYQLTRLVSKPASQSLASERLQLMGAGNFQEQHLKFRAFMLERQQPHTFVQGEKRKHHWNSGWFAPAMERLVPTEFKSKTAAVKNSHVE